MEGRCEVRSEETEAQCIRSSGHTLELPHMGLFKDDGSFEVWADDGGPTPTVCPSTDSVRGDRCWKGIGHKEFHESNMVYWRNNPFSYVTDISDGLMRQMMKRPTFAAMAAKIGYTTEEFLAGVKDGSRQIREAFENDRYSQDVEDAGEVMKASLTDDPVNHPAHYTAYPGIEIIDLTKHMNFCRGNAVKYIARAGLKDPSKEIEDLEKAVFYINKEIEMLKEESDG